MMKCPWCKTEMEDGCIQSPEGDIVYREAYENFFAADEHDIVLNKNAFTSPRVKACICKQCKKIVIEY